MIKYFKHLFYHIFFMPEKEQEEVWITGQLFPSYDSKDLVGAFQDVTRSFENIESPIIRSEINKIKIKTLMILISEKDEKRDFRNDFIGLQHKVKWEQLRSISPQKQLLLLFKNTIKRIFFLSKVYDKPNPTLLNQIIQETNILLDEYKKNLNSKDSTYNFFENIDKSKDFNQNINFVKENFWHTWVVIFLQECLKKWYYKPQEIKEYCEKNKDLFSANKDSFEYWNYRNTMVLAWEKENIKEWKAFSLSWWISNWITQLWIMKKYLENWWKVSFISWSSIWALIWVFTSFGSNWLTLERIEKVENLLKKYFWWNAWDINYAKEWDINKQQIEIRQKFIDIALELWIRESSNLSECKVPIIVNSSRFYWSWEQEIYLWWNDKIIDSIKATTNINWTAWKTKIDWVEMVDYAMNERWNPTEPLKILWISNKDKIIIDVWYSSEKYYSNWAIFSRWFFPRAFDRDEFEKSIIKNDWWTVMNIDSEPSWNWNWEKFSWEIIKSLLKIWGNEWIKY